MSERGRIGRPPKVNREQVVAAAADILTTDGPLKFSMRTLAARLDISAMGIYHYFDSKNDLLGAVLEHQSWNTPVPELAGNPHERLVQLPLIVIDHLTQHPWVIDVLSADEIIDAYSAWSFDEFLRTTDEIGIPEDESLHLLLGLWRFTIGEVTVRTNQAMRDARPSSSAWYQREIPKHVIDRPRLARALGALDPSAETYDVRQTILAYLRGALGDRFHG
ncbi:TetR/AcrR family transcriptional regulator [Tsukamurella ocularis]|uniref:TetR/AcrR family transcriptional regulator n=1 Tax=Tsukamurella ocularis TaxID=1970234 RepID=UPI002166FB5E|nr:TetR/AcrR family transcriptional regulator [Tsukamurella ocularis]MCS3781581.1 AcrR family transcriptional regulator [Tsukamurella ocularis]MCS3787953.1 AcrR family transcriptional regulator [Tsukamurella ocularis]MCS3851248.1 AcrR family transcriptional regulator [Tsukamurella ocularis]